MFSIQQLICHLIGDYVIQSSWMANEKIKKSYVAAIHSLIYSLPFLLLGISLVAWIAIVIPHFFIDRFRLARHVIYLKNMMAPKGQWKPWSECNKTGYHNTIPDWLSVWLLIVTDNTIHLVTNGIALHYL
jgi:hypothetical protein